MPTTETATAAGDEPPAVTLRGLAAHNFIELIRVMDLIPRGEVLREDNMPAAVWLVWQVHREFKRAGAA